MHVRSATLLHENVYTETCWIRSLRSLKNGLKFWQKVSGTITNDITWLKWNSVFSMFPSPWFLCRLVCAPEICSFLLFLLSCSSFLSLCFTWLFSFNKSTSLDYLYVLPVVIHPTRFGSFLCNNFATFCYIQCQSWTHKFQKACAFYYIYFNVTYTFLHVTISLILCPNFHY